MKVGYACINTSLKCRSSRTLRLKSYSEEKIVSLIENNLHCLQEILEFNLNHQIYFFRISSDLIPLASHPIMEFNWQDYFKAKFEAIGAFINKSKMRITMHPGQYTVLNSTNEKVFQNTLKELEYHVEVLDLMKLNKSAKVQIHVGGVYGDKEKSLQRFINRYFKLDDKIKNRLIIENDDKSYSLRDCLEISEIIQIPIVFDVYHHECLNSGEQLNVAFEKFMKTWTKNDGSPIVHYSSEHSLKGKPSHIEKININHFKDFLDKTKKYDFDLMLEIKDKEQSTLKVIKLLENDPRFINQN
jgi:UV DNA damage endonuclease